MQPMEDPIKDQKLLWTFLKPPTEPLPSVHLPLPSRAPIRASNFGGIPIALSRDDDSDSLYAYPDEPSRENAHPAARLLPATDGAELQLVLDNPSQTYAPSEAVTGYILGWDPACTDLHIILEGREKTYIRRDKTQYKDRAPLLYQVTHLTSEDLGTLYRFSITVPERTADGLEKLGEYAPTNAFYGKYWTYDWPAQDSYEQQAGHPLPPTMSMPNCSSTELGSYAEGWGHISYKLVAVCSQRDTATGKFTPVGSCQVFIRLTTRRLPLEKVQELTQNTDTSSSDLSVQTVQLLKERRLSIREQLRDTFTETLDSGRERQNIDLGDRPASTTWKALQLRDTRHLYHGTRLPRPLLHWSENHAKAPRRAASNRSNAYLQAQRATHTSVTS
ncbi:hypothetical protein CC80DRAFT_229792 [Byssothecium circinans]|uniref:Uncharacterized protein n=1 Tax=Byssothecium circinans TaxID=147558 RepID=A0A6A5UAW4_9PLEO|nr:hypothetical protein CC80DRAFT_229792 [Byssothecium circinans]